MTPRITIRRLAGLVAGTAIAAGLMASGPARAQDDILVGLVVKTEANPFFAKMREGASQKAAELGVKFQSFAGKYDGDHDAQVTAVENLISAGASGILITASRRPGEIIIGSLTAIVRACVLPGRRVSSLRHA